MTQAATVDSALLSLSKRIARHVFKCGNDSRLGEVRRIQFMHGEWGTNERPGGGFCEEALASAIFDALKGRDK